MGPAETKRLQQLLSDGDTSQWREYLDSSSAPAFLVRLCDCDDEALARALRRVRALALVSPSDTLTQAGDLVDFVGRRSKEDIGERDRAADPHRRWLGEVRPANTLETVARRARVIAEELIRDDEQLYGWPDIAIEIPVTHSCLERLSRTRRFAPKPGAPERLIGVWSIDGGYILQLEAIGLSEGTVGWRPAGRSFQAKSEGREAAARLPEVSLAEALPGAYCAHEQGRWVRNDGLSGPDTAHLTCEDCLGAQIAAVPLHQVDPGSGILAPDLEDLSSLVGEEAYLLAQRFHQTLAGDPRPVSSLDQLRARDGYLPMDPALHAIGTPPARTPRTGSVAKAMNRR